MPSITIRIVDQYGRNTAHPVCAAAHVFASIAGTKTLSEENLSHIRFLGYEIRLDAAPAITAARQIPATAPAAPADGAFRPTAAQLRAGRETPVLEVR